MRAERWAGWLAVVAGCASAPSGAPEPAPVAVRVLSFNDFHGHLLPDPSGAGGAAQLGGLLDSLRDESTLVVSPGDLVGASPLVSAHFRDEPTIELMNLIGLDVFGLGNHEFDEGYEELLRLRDGDPESGFAGANFPFLGANVHLGDGEPVFEPYRTFVREGIPIAFIGLTLEETAEIVAPDLGPVRFADEVQTVERYVRELRARGVEAFVILLHEGGRQTGGPNECRDLEGPIRGIVEELPGAVDVVLSGHTHQSYVCEIDGKLLTAGGSNAEYVTQVDLELSPVTRDVVRMRAVNLAVDASAPRDLEIASLVDRYSARIDRVSRRVVGQTRAPMSKDPLETGESTLGSFIADAQRAATRADVAITNLGGIRSDLGLGGSEVTFGDLFQIQPFDNRMVVIEMSGAELLDMLESQWDVSSEWGLYQISSSLRYCWSDPDPTGSRIVRSSVRVGGRLLREDDTYTVALNSYLANKPPFTDAPRVDVLGSDVEALENFVSERSPIAPPDPGRICRTPGPRTAQSVQTMEQTADRR
jgi:5'-nucleotidase